jgi:hypothetical protein
MRYSVFLFALLVACGFAITGEAQDAVENSTPFPIQDPIPEPRDVAPPDTSNKALGTWKLNLEKSKFSPGEPPRTNVRQFVARPDGFIVSTISGISAQGIPTFTMSVARYDGKNYRLYNQVTLAELMMHGTKTPTTQAYKVIDDYTVEITNRENGKVTTVLTRTVSRDLKTMTLVTKGTNTQGQAVNNVEVFDKQ